jgi:UDP-N-acetylglucosamine 2-epimerase
VPCITLRDVTEWEETIENGFNVLVGSNEEKIYESIKNFEINQKNKELYGKGDASKKIADILEKLKK